MKNSIILSFLALSLFGCGGKSHLANQFISHLSNDPRSSIDYDLQKLHPERGGGWILVQGGLEVRAIDIYSLSRVSYLNDLDYFNNHSRRVYLVGGNTWVDSDGILYEQKPTSQKDLEKLASEIEKGMVQDLGQSLSERFGLSEERGLKVADLVFAWNKVSAQRGITDSDADSFSKGLLGFDLNQGIKAYEELKIGKNEDFNNLLEIAAKTNGISPELLNQIIQEYINP